MESDLGREGQEQVGVVGVAVELDEVGSEKIRRDSPHELFHSPYMLVW